MSKAQIIILFCLPVISLGASLLFGLLLKISKSSKANYSKTIEQLEQDRSFKL